MDKPRYVYVSEIATTAEKLWSALTGNEFWQQFSGPVESDWKAGSRVKYFLPDGKLYAEGVVLESRPPHLLSHTWPDPQGEQAIDSVQRLTWTIEQVDSGTVKLTMVHENMTEKAYDGVSQGWPVLLDGLKSRLEGAGR